MILSKRLESIVKMVPQCRCIADIGTDHGYIPIYTVLNNISSRAIASDINKGPIQAAIQNVKRNRVTDKIETRIGPGLSTLKPDDADVIVIAGMGGHLIGEILRDNISIAKNADCIILQPAQFPEALRKHLFESNFKIVDEDMVKEDNKLYHIMKVEKGLDTPYEKEVYYYVGRILLGKRHPLLREFVMHKIMVLDKILLQLNPEVQSVRFQEVTNLLKDFREVLKCL